ncbi:radical SAM peptide maturase [Bacteroidales bacterium OttesenSCG-928-I14]|nr:radical SAM peptide maturase [Bacteroidales bacterium OttesenSCG-928-I14]
MKETYQYLSAKNVEYSLANTSQITFEVTDACNLNCTYCGYGKFYSDHDARENKKLLSQQAILFLDYLKQLWESSLNKSYQNNIYISFYGGEPLLNMDFIKEVVHYINKEIKCSTRTFTFSMTTNAILLHKYMDYLVENKFNLLISLDGDEYNTSYRVDHAGNPSFCKIINNVDILKQKYPEYFDLRVNFNAVLHNRNSVESIYSFIKGRYNKIPSIGELNNMGIRPEMKKEFLETYRNSYESLRQSEHYEEIEKDMFIQSGTYQSVSTYLLQHSEFVYKDYNELLFGKREGYSIPTGTCLPFAKKVFVTVNGKILPCERIGHQFGLGQLTEKGVDLDFEAIAYKYNQYYAKVDKQCKACFNKKACIQCIFNLPDIDNEKVVCHGFMSKKNFEAYQSQQLAFLANHPEDYHRIMTEVIVK